MNTESHLKIANSLVVIGCIMVIAVAIRLVGWAGYLIATEWPWWAILGSIGVLLMLSSSLASIHYSQKLWEERVNKDEGES